MTKDNQRRNNMNKMKAFTLTESLIMIAIVGVIATKIIMKKIKQ